MNHTKVVSYHADPVGYGGYVADVKYEGVAHPGPAYKPAPHPKVVPVAHPAHPLVPVHPVRPLVAHPVVAHPLVHPVAHAIAPIHG